MEQKSNFEYKIYYNGCIVKILWEEGENVVKIYRNLACKKSTLYTKPLKTLILK